jgi:hypothetical protein
VPSADTVDQRQDALQVALAQRQNGAPDGGEGADADQLNSQNGRSLKAGSSRASR